MAHAGEHIHSTNEVCCCNSGECGHARDGGVSRREFLAASGIALSATALTSLAPLGAASAAEADAPALPRRKLVVQPILCHDLPEHRPQTSWRSWGGIHTKDAAREELDRISKELDAMRGAADFPVEFRKPVAALGPEDVKKAIGDCDAVLYYAAGGGGDALDAAVQSGKDVIFFLRHRSGPVYLWYEIISPRYLRQHGDDLAVPGVDYSDVVVDSTDEVLWRLRALCGLRNSLNTRILALGGASGWGPQGGDAPTHGRKTWKLDIQELSYADFEPILKEAMNSDRRRRIAEKRAKDYLADPGVSLETEKEYVVNAFVLDEVLRKLLHKYEANTFTINNCMGAIMPISKTTACLTLSTLNDDGYLAFCESDFVVIPSGILMANITGRPQFLNDPTYPHDGVITLAHCTAPRRLDGVNREPVRLVTHFESDYGAAPKVEMAKGTVVTNVIPDFAGKRYTGFVGEIVDAPFLPICRSQIDVAYRCPDEVVARSMPGFHWETIYGDCMREVGFALRKAGIGWTPLA